MAGRRPLTLSEQRLLLRALRTSSPRDRALVTTQWLSGARLSEILSLTVGDVCRPNGELVHKIAFRPSCLKGGYGSTRWVPMSPELVRALSSYLGWLGKRWELTQKLPLFLSRQDFPDQEARAITREAARLVIRGVFSRAGIHDDGRLGSHSLRKAWAYSIYRAASNDVLVVKAALGHSNLTSTQAYLSASDSAVEAAMRKVDFTRPTRWERLATAQRPESRKDLCSPVPTEVAGLPVPLEGQPLITVSANSGENQGAAVGQGTNDPGTTTAALPPAA